MHGQDRHDPLPFLDRPVAALAVCLAAKVVTHTRGLVPLAAAARRAARRAASQDEMPSSDPQGSDSINAADNDDNDSSSAVQERRHGIDDLWRTDPDAAVKGLVDRCREAEATSPSAWRPFLDAYAATLPTRGVVLDDTDESGSPVYSTGTALAVVQRILPILDAHRLVVYGMRLRPEHADYIAGPWDRVVPRPMVEIDCGTGDWLLQVAAGRLWSDDVREGQETAGGVLAVRFAVNRRTGVLIDADSVWLGEGRDATVDALFAFFRSGAPRIDAYVDARYGRICRAPTALTASLGWTLADDDKGNGYGLCRPWSIVSADSERATVFVRASDGRRVQVVSKRGSVFVSVGSGRVWLPAAAYPTPPERDGIDYPFAVPRPPADYAEHDDYCDNDEVIQEHYRRVCGDRDHLIAQGLLDPMHMISEWIHRHKGNGISTLSLWPYVRFEFDPEQRMDATAEADWHARLSARMHLVADLACGNYGPSVDPDALAIASASALMAPVFPSDPQGAPWPVNARTCDAVFDHLTSLGAARPWRISRQKDNLRYGNRYHDPTRGLCVNWFVECNFAQCTSDEARPTVRFYGHIVGLDAGAKPVSLRDPTSDSLTAVAAYYCLTARARMPGHYDDDVWDPNDEDDAAVAADAAFDAARPAPTTRFATDQPHPLVAYYREREFDLAPGHFRGILDEDATRVDAGTGSRSAAAALVSALDWLATAFDRHATLFALRADP
ncbi:hypothetical protein pdul_cds_124 [Pandoravirus dulcis]|uniref:Uncharacterized protein n=1 Tax=Pandoravirus dulcis TaxID=1349409 RepID=S4VVD0_9VIRU|nr:hypothetical protein pdul_cds_124 [Pandoravirus dulcis]AGO82036.1 hypothetical protein pdul_cds_124 [Pandoravirus dulcis]